MTSMKISLVPVTHLTLTGPLAGVTLCGNKFVGDRTAHAAYVKDIDQLDPIACPRCVEAWYAEGEHDPGGA